MTLNCRSVCVFKIAGYKSGVLRGESRPTVFARVWEPEGKRMRLMA